MCLYRLLLHGIMMLIVAVCRRLPEIFFSMVVEGLFDFILLSVAVRNLFGCRLDRLDGRHFPWIPDGTRTDGGCG